MPRAPMAMVTTALSIWPNPRGQPEPRPIRQHHHPRTAMDNTLLGRCTVAFQEGLNGTDYPCHTTRAQRAGVAEVLLHLAAEITVLRQTEPRLTAHEISTWLVQQASPEVVG